MADSVLYQITAPHLCAGITFIAGRCVDSAPILAWAKGKTIDYMLRYCKRKGWDMEVVEEHKQA